MKHNVSRNAAILTKFDIAQVPDPAGTASRRNAKSVTLDHDKWKTVVIPLAVALGNKTKTKHQKKNSAILTTFGVAQVPDPAGTGSQRNARSIIWLNINGNTVFFIFLLSWFYISP